MAGELIWSRAALEDLDALATFIARDSPVQARRLVEQAFLAAEQELTQLSRRRQAADESLTGVLARPVRGFSLLFERQGRDIHVLALIPAG